MLKFYDYQIHSQIYESGNSLVYRGYRECDRQPVILKILKPDYPTPEELTRYKREYEITRSLKLDGVIKVYNLLKYQNSLVIVLEDIGGDSLDILMKSRKFNLLEFLWLAIEIAKNLGDIHAANIIHKDINPSNIVFNLQTKQIKIIDFGISTVFSREEPTIQNPYVLEGTLAYLSPEQTGRMNRKLDYRTDFYSLGATFYKMLTERVPFETNDALELMHYHIAKSPTPPHELVPEIPEVLSKIVIKLLAKTAEDRYQSAWGLQADLEECLRQLQDSGQIIEFPLAGDDISDNFKIPQKLYGRESEIETLLAAFERVANPDSKGEHRRREMMLVAGYSGIGKSVLVQELYKPITKRRGYFVSGKFDQFQRSVPYFAIVQAFQSLIRQLLSENESQLAQWRKKLLVAFGSNGQMMIDVIPELELIVGSQPAIAQIDAKKAQTLFNLVFQNFVRVFCQQSHPLVLFLDDLQWADSASLKLIELMISDEQTQYLFLIGAYRDNEVNSLSPLTITVDQLKRESVTVNQITLKPLNLNHINQLITDTLHQNHEIVQPFAELIMQKTEGNPFFVNEFLKTLYQEELLTFDLQKRSWQWNISQIEEIGITNNVVELMIDKLKKLPELTQQVLCLAACLGNSFNLETLSIIHGKSILATFSELLPAIKQGTILPMSELEAVEKSEGLDSQLLIFDYKFLHDRVQNAAYVLIDESQKKQVHLRIGMLLLKNTPQEKKAEKIFDFVAHLNQAQDLIEDDQEKLKLAHLNLEAAKKAKDATAYIAAQRYLNIAKNLLEENDYRENYELFFTVHQELAEVEYLNGNYEQVQRVIDFTLARTKSAVEKAQLYQILIVLYATTANYEQAIQIGRKSLSLLDIELPESNFKLAIETEIAQIKEKLRNRSIDSLMNEPKMIIPTKKAAIKILGAMDSSAYMLNTNLFALLTAKQVNLSLKYGNLPEAVKFYSDYGIVMIYILKDYHAAYEFGLLALKLSEKFINHSQKCQVSLVLSYWLSCWLKPLKSIDTILKNGYQSGLQSGEIQFSGYTLAYILFTDFSRGVNLEKILTKIFDSYYFCKKTKNYLASELILGFQLNLLNLIAISEDKFNFQTEQITELQYLQDGRSPHAICIYHIFKSQVLYLCGQFQEALSSSLEAESLLTWIAGQYFVSEHNFYYSLVLAAIYPEVSPQEQKQYWEKLQANQKQMKIWADNCSENFGHKYLLLSAEMARISDKWTEAMDLYDQAIACAEKSEFIQNESLANELAAKFWLARGKEKFTQLYLKRAHQGYQIWGAQRKVKELEEKYPQWLSSKSSRKLNIFSNSSVTNSQNLEKAIDLETFIRASQAISEEMALDKLLEKLMKIVMENAGAQKGFLLLPSQTVVENENVHWVIEAARKVNKNNTCVIQSIPVDFIEPSTKNPILSIAIINYVARTQESLVLNDATHEGLFIHDLYIIATQPKSVLCVPLINQNKLNGILYLENNLTVGAFTPDRLEVIRLLSSQAAIAIANAKLYTELQQNQTRLSQFLEAMPVGVSVHDPTGKIYYANQIAKKLFQDTHASADAKTEQLSEVYQVYKSGTEQLYPTQQLPIACALSGKTAKRDDLELRLTNKTIPLEISATPIFDEAGKIKYAITAFQDITERKRAETECLNFNYELEQKNIALQQAKDQLAEYSTTLEQKVLERTQELSQTLEILQATQEELLFENELLRNTEQTSNFDYQVGGSLPMEAQTYVVRAADRYLYKALKQGDFCYVLHPRQMGKSSLMVRMIHHFQQEGYCCVPIDMTRIGSENITPNQWYKGFAFELARRLRLLSKINFKPWWNERECLSPVQKLNQFIEEVLLVEVKGEDGTCVNSLIIFIDEIDSVLSLGFPVNDFFALIRSCYNQRTLNPEYKRLTFALFGVASPSNLINNIQTTPFNIGKSIQLEGFKEHEAQPLLQGLTNKVNNPQTILKKVLAWTSGQPFLTQKLCQLILNEVSIHPPNNDEVSWIDNVVRTKVIDNWEFQDEPEHLRTIRDRILKSQQSFQLLKLYRQVLEQEEINITNTPELKELLLSGIVVKQEGVLKVHNRIYESIFDRSWVKCHMGRQVSS